MCNAYASDPTPCCDDACVVFPEVYSTLLVTLFLWSFCISAEIEHVRRISMATSLNCCLQGPTAAVLFGTYMSQASLCAVHISSA